MTKIFLLDRVNSSKMKKKKREQRNLLAAGKEVENMFLLHYEVSVTGVDLTPGNPCALLVLNRLRCNKKQIPEYVIVGS